MNQMKQEDKDYEEILRLLEEEADNWLLENSVADEFEDTPNDPVRLFRFEYQHETISNARTTRFKKYKAD